MQGSKVVAQGLLQTPSVLVVPQLQPKHRADGTAPTTLIVPGGGGLFRLKVSVRPPRGLGVVFTDAQRASGAEWAYGRNARDPAKTGFGARRKARESLWKEKGEEGSEEKVVMRDGGEMWKVSSATLWEMDGAMGESEEGQEQAGVDRDNQRTATAGAEPTEIAIPYKTLRVVHRLRDTRGSGIALGLGSSDPRIDWIDWIDTEIQDTQVTTG
ncbi:unnamed protein product [Cutaneotrichosporon oleaginosum]